MIPDDIDRTTRDFFWRYDQGLPSHYGFKPLDAPTAPTTPFRKFLADCLTPDQAAELQVVFGSLYSKTKRERRLSERVYIHTGNGANGKTTLLDAVGAVFGMVPLYGRTRQDLERMNRECLPFAVWEKAKDISTHWFANMARVGSGGLAYALLNERPKSMLTDSLHGDQPSQPVSIHLTMRNLDELEGEAGMLRRSEIFEWEKTIPAGQRDPAMAAKIAADPDFLVWLAEGLRHFQTCAGFIRIHGVLLPLGAAPRKTKVSDGTQVCIKLRLFSDGFNDWWENFKNMKDRLIVSDPGKPESVPVIHDDLWCASIKGMVFTKVGIPVKVGEFYDVDLEGFAPHC